MKRMAQIMAAPAFRFIMIMGLVNLFGDMTYEGGASINGPFLGMLGAGPATISVIAGAGEFLGYGLRSVAGYIADRTGKYWPISFVGYTINLFAVPAMALAGNWQVAAGLVLLERIGRAIRKPTVESMLSYTTARYGKGWIFAVNTALDETGATLGPLIVALVLFLRGSYSFAYALLAISSVLAIASLVVARINFPVPSDLEQSRTASETGFTASYWLYMTGSAFFAAGLMSYELIAYYLTKAGFIAQAWMPVALALATGCGIIANLVLGRLFDRVGLRVVLFAIILSACFTPLVFSGSLPAILLAMPLWGVSYAVQDTLFKAIVASVLPETKRGLAFGLFYTGYGTGWLVGSIVVGLLFERSHLLVMVFAITAQALSLPFLLMANRQQKGNPSQSNA